MAETAAPAAVDGSTAAAKADSMPATASAASVASFLYTHRHLFLIQGRLFALTLSIIYVGAHAALQRPFSAAPAAKKRGRRAGAGAASSALAKEGLQMSDALMLPLMAGAALVGLYYLMQYMQDPELLNRILRGYMSAMSVASMGKLLGDGLGLATSLVFPRVWARGGPGGRGEAMLFRVDPGRQRQLRWAGGAAWVVDESRLSPFPDGLAWLARSTAARRTAWSLRRLCQGEWRVRVALCGLGQTTADGLTLAGLAGVLAAGALMAASYVLPGRAARLLLSAEGMSNLMGLGFCYGGFLLMSCTSFVIGALVLGGLFVYDIVMVFYTPFMVTVATKLDAPIKLVAQSGGRSSLLGLGDIVVPGIYICLCLRYDLHRHYARQTKAVPTTLATVVRRGEGAAGTDTETRTTTALRQVKPAYIDPQGRWGDWLWTARHTAALARRGGALPTPGLQAAAFAKPCFHVAMAAYVVGLAMAVGAMLATGRGQPALLYLVPSVLLSTLGWGWWAGELREMWAYSEDREQDVKDVVVEVGADGKVVEVEGGERGEEEGKGGERGEGRVEEKEKEEGKREEQEEEGKEGEKQEKDGKEGEKQNDSDGYDVFVFVVRAPAEADVAEIDI